MPHYDYDKDYPFAAFITNLGKYNEGDLVGEWVKFPTTPEEMQKVFERIGIGQKDDFGQPYEEWFITDYDCYVDGLYDKLGEYESLDELNYLASKLDEMSQGEYEQFQAAMEIGDHSGSLQEIINLTENLDCYDIYPDIHDHDDLGRYYIEELDAMQVPEHLRNYIDYEAYGRDVALEEGGEFTNLGYVRDTGSSFHEYYDGEHGSIPEEYRVMTFQDAKELTEEEKSEWAMDIAYDMDEFFRQHDPQYAAEHPEEHAAKEEIYENLMAGRISALDEKLAALGQTQEDYLPSEIEKFKDATGYEEFLDFDPAVIREAIQNPDKSHVDEMLAFAEQAGREYEAELAGQATVPSPDDRETSETVRTPRGTFYVTDMSREQMEAAGYGLHHQSDDGKYLIMGNGSRSFAIRSEEAQEHAAPEKMTVLVVEPMKEPYVKEIDPGLHSLQAEVGGDIATAYPFSDPVGLVCNDEGKLIGLELNRGLRDEHGEIYDVMAGTFLVVGLGEESFTSLTPEQVQKYTEHFKQPEQFISLNGQIIALPVEPENPLRTAEMTLEDDYGMIDGVLNNGRKGEELEKAQGEARRTTPEKKPSIRERLAEAKRECGERKPPDKTQQKKPPEHDL
ncbi:antirestriction protein ArdA [Anaerotignum lactatifermentans]|uniref:Antirestriction protein ArdA n=1 Tax=Anaerotignum lactatifermentans TaxID=160404 RepID=A0ABS2GBC2_9FIRM|nr:antirestriction protein ArdA [Anaerotignum lactatifermentans]MBM6829634.1 antirestriction protein ArdA [Anaerotignum lactatifermentans]MBM6878177.1 antirestriction protein ArdA [Anaerotignum lactatifermentans]MBM6951209.1 antirestriction protein ArdA [Anaerotignum lactatifermentans]